MSTQPSSDNSDDSNVVIAGPIEPGSAINSDVV